MLRPQVLDLNALVSDTERLLRRLIGEGIELVLELDPAAGSIKADPGQMQTVTMNLAVNARDAMPKGGRLTLQTSTVEFEPNGARAEILPGRYALLTVEDTGMGMDELTRSRIFEPFFTTKEMGKGTGLGLSTVCGILKQSEGHIWVQTEIGKGAKFTICLPAVTTAAESKGTLAEQPAPAAGRGKLLIVEDQREVRDLACRILQSAGYDVLQAANGAEALQVAKESGDSLDLLLTDIVMPGMTGPELAARLKSRHPGLKVLFMSGYSNHASAGKGPAGSEADHLQKPFPPVVLIRKVREILGPARNP